MAMITRSIIRNINGNYINFFFKNKTLPPPGFALKWNGQDWVYVGIKKRKISTKKVIKKSKLVI